METKQAARLTEPIEPLEGLKLLREVRKLRDSKLATDYSSSCSVCPYRAGRSRVVKPWEARL